MAMKVKKRLSFGIILIVHIVNVFSFSYEHLSETFAANFDIYTDILNAKFQSLQRNIEGNFDKIDSKNLFYLN